MIQVNSTEESCQPALVPTLITCMLQEMLLWYKLSCLMLLPRIFPLHNEEHHFLFPLVWFFPLGPAAIFNEMQTLLIADRCFLHILLNKWTIYSIFYSVSHIMTRTLTSDLLSNVDYLQIWYPRMFYSKETSTNFTHEDQLWKHITSKNSVLLQPSFKGSLHQLYI